MFEQSSVCEDLTKNILAFTANRLRFARMDNK